MNAVIGKAGNAGSVLATIGDWPGRLPGRQSKTLSSHRPAHIGIRIQKKIMQFDRKIALFRQRRWS